MLKCNFIFGNTLYALCQQLRCKSLPKMLYNTRYVIYLGLMGFMRLIWDLSNLTLLCAKHQFLKSCVTGKKLRVQNWICKRIQELS